MPMTAETAPAPTTTTTTLDEQQRRLDWIKQIQTARMVAGTMADAVNDDDDDGDDLFSLLALHFSPELQAQSINEILVDGTHNVDDGHRAAQKDRNRLPRESRAYV